MATTFFGRSCSRLQVVDLASDLERSAKAELSADSQAAVLAEATALSAAAER